MDYRVSFTEDKHKCGACENVSRARVQVSGVFVCPECYADIFEGLGFPELKEEFCDNISAQLNFRKSLLEKVG